MERRDRLDPQVACDHRKGARLSLELVDQPRRGRLRGGSISVQSLDQEQLAPEGGDQDRATVTQKPRLGRRAPLRGQGDGLQKGEVVQCPDLDIVAVPTAPHVGAARDHTVQPGDDREAVGPDVAPLHVSPAPADRGPVRPELRQPACRVVARAFGLEGRQHVPTGEALEAVGGSQGPGRDEGVRHRRGPGVPQVEDVALTRTEVVREEEPVVTHPVLGVVATGPAVRRDREGDQDVPVGPGRGVRVDHGQEVQIRRVGVRDPGVEELPGPGLAGPATPGGLSGAVARGTGGQGSRGQHPQAVPASSAQARRACTRGLEEGHRALHPGRQPRPGAEAEEPPEGHRVLA